MDPSVAITAEIHRERQRQLLTSGRGLALDDTQQQGELLLAALCYALPEADVRAADRRGDLIRAGALLVAEIERLDRAGPQGVRPREAGRPIVSGSQRR